MSSLNSERRRLRVLHTTVPRCGFKRPLLDHMIASWSYVTPQVESLSDEVVLSLRKIRATRRDVWSRYEESMRNRRAYILPCSNSQHPSWITDEPFSRIYLLRYHMDPAELTNEEILTLCHNWLDVVYCERAICAVLRQPDETTDSEFYMRKSIRVPSILDVNAITRETFRNFATECLLLYRLYQRCNRRLVILAHTEPGPFVKRGVLEYLLIGREQVGHVEDVSSESTAKRTLATTDAWLQYVVRDSRAFDNCFPSFSHCTRVVDRRKIIVAMQSNCSMPQNKLSRLICTSETDEPEKCDCEMAQTELVRELIRTVQDIERSAFGSLYPLYSDIDVKWGSMEMIMFVWKKISVKSFVRQILPLLGECRHLYECCDIMCKRSWLDTCSSGYEDLCYIPVGGNLDYSIFAKGWYGDLQLRWHSMAINWATQGLVFGVVEVLARGVIDNLLDSSDMIVIRHVYARLMYSGAIALALPLSFFVSESMASSYLTGKHAQYVLNEQHQNCKVLGNSSAMTVMNFAKELAFLPTSTNYFVWPNSEGDIRLCELIAARDSPIDSAGNTIPLQYARGTHTSMALRGYRCTRTSRNYRETFAYYLRRYCNLACNYMYDDAKWANVKMLEDYCESQSCQ